jgi:hypothetical protein
VWFRPSTPQSSMGAKGRSVVTHHEHRNLLIGPYHPPKTRRGARLFCEIRGTQIVGGFRDGNPRF